MPAKTTKSVRPFAGVGAIRIWILACLVVVSGGCQNSPPPPGAVESAVPHATSVRLPPPRPPATPAPEPLIKARPANLQPLSIGQDETSGALDALLSEVHGSQQFRALLVRVALENEQRALSDWLEAYPVKDYAAFRSLLLESLLDEQADVRNTAASLLLGFERYLAVSGIDPEPIPGALLLAALPGLNAQARSDLVVMLSSADPKNPILPAEMARSLSPELIDTLRSNDFCFYVEQERLLWLQASPEQRGEVEERLHALKPFVERLIDTHDRLSPEWSLAVDCSKQLIELLPEPGRKELETVYWAVSGWRPEDLRRRDESRWIYSVVDLEGFEDFAHLEELEHDPALHQETTRQVLARREGARAVGVLDDVGAEVVLFAFADGSFESVHEHRELLWKHPCPVKQVQLLRYGQPIGHAGIEGPGDGCLGGRPFGLSTDVDLSDLEGVTFVLGSEAGAGDVPEVHDFWRNGKAYLAGEGLTRLELEGATDLDDDGIAEILAHERAIEIGQSRWAVYRYTESEPGVWGWLEVFSFGYGMGC